MSGNEREGLREAVDGLLRTLIDRCAQAEGFDERPWDWVLTHDDITDRILALLTQAQEPVAWVCEVKHGSGRWVEDELVRTEGEAVGWLDGAPDDVNFRVRPLVYASPVASGPHWAGDADDPMCGRCGHDPRECEPSGAVTVSRASAPARRPEVEKDEEGRPYPCGAFVSGDGRWYCRLESDHVGEHEWMILLSTKDYTHGYDDGYAAGVQDASALEEERETLRISKDMVAFLRASQTRTTSDDPVYVRATPTEKQEREPYRSDRQDMADAEYGGER